MRSMMELSRGVLLVFSLFLSLCVHNNLQCLNLLAAAQAVPVKVGVVLDKESLQGKVSLSCVNMAISDIYAAHPEFKTRIALHVRDSKDHDIVMAAAAVSDLIKKEQVAAIIGPETSEEAQFVIHLGGRAHVPIVSYSATSPFLSPSQNPYFVRAVQDDSSQVQPLAAFIQAFGWRQVVPIYVDDDFGGGIVSFLADALQEIGTIIPYSSVLPSSASNYQMLAELYKLKSLSTRVFVVHMPISLGSKLFLKAKQLGMMSQDYVWIVTNAMGNVLNDATPQVIQSMQGVVGVINYVPTTRELDNFTVRWQMKFQQENPTLLNTRLDIYGLLAYDAATALARAVEEVGVTNFTFQQTKSVANLSSDISALGVSKLGNTLLQEISKSNFSGLSGNFILDDRQLQSSTFQLINVRGSGSKEIGYWTPSTGFVKVLNSKNISRSITSSANLLSIRWPGNPTSFPRGWVSSPNGKKLKIGVPIKAGFLQFVAVTRDTATNRTKVSGFCIDVFNAVMSKLPYSVPYEYIPYSEHEGEPTTSYDDLIEQVKLKNFDAVVGDVTIRANRSFSVDFTLPYSESEIIMIVPVKDNKKIRAWLFIRPLTWDLWVTTFCFFFFIAFVVWLLEHRINDDFRGPPGHQAGTSLYYSFSTMVFSQSFNVYSNLTRFVVIIWIFVVLILIQSYTANLASLLTVEQLQPTFTNITELKNKGLNVAHQEGSFVRGLLLKMKFSVRQLTTYNSTDQLDELLTKGTAKGGVAAAVDETPFLKLFLAEYCSKYTMVGPTYKADGFGFAFPRGSPLVSDVSREVLTVREGDEMTALENKWFKTNTCADSNPPFSSKSLGVDSFWGLFMIAGAAALLSVIISLASFLKEHRNVWSDQTAPAWSRFKTLLRIFDNKNLNSHTFRKNQPNNPSFTVTLPNTPGPQSPSSYCENGERGFNEYEAQSTPSENMDPSSIRSANEEGDAAD